MADAKLSGTSFARAPATAPERSFIAQGTTGGDLYRQDNYSATAAPTATDDASAGYSRGSEWYNGARGVLYICHDPTAGAAIWRRVRRGHIGYLVGNWYVGEGIGNPVVSATATAAGTRIYLHPFFVPEPVTISDLGFKTGSTVAGNTELAIYRANAPGGRPGTRIGVAGPVANAAATTAYSASLVDGALVLEPGWYWAASITDVACTFVSLTATQNAAASASLGSSTLGNVVTALGVVLGLDLAGTYSSDPKASFPADLSASTFTDHTVGRFPLVGFKVSALQ